jgi:hypothetical protein
MQNGITPFTPEKSAGYFVATSEEVIGKEEEPGMLPTSLNCLTDIPLIIQCTIR